MGSDQKAYKGAITFRRESVIELSAKSIEEKSSSLNLNTSNDTHA